MTTPGAGLAAVVLACALAVPACGGNDKPSPQQVATKWRTADFNGDFEASWALEAPELAGPADKKADTIARRRRLFKPHTPLGDIEVTRTVKDDTQKEVFVFVYLRLSAKDGGLINDEAVTLRRVKGGWRVAKWEP